MAAGAAPSLVWLLPVAVVGAAIWLRVNSIENADVSWLLTLAEKLLDGRHDFIELNPPGAIYAYLPAVWLARILHVSPEATCDALVFLLTALSLGLVAYVLGRRFAARHDLALVTTAAVAILLLLPDHTFGEREHLGVILILPWTAALAVRLEGARPASRLLAAAGVACGLCVMIKPHFILNVGVLSLVLAWRTRSWKMLFTLENCIAAVMLLLYGVAVWVAFPDFLLHTAPMAAAVYVPNRLPLATLTSAFVSVLWVSICTLSVALIALMGTFRRGATLSPVLLAMSAVSYFSFLLQGKGWAYHSYPAIGFALLALAVQLGWSDATTARSTLYRALGVACAAVMFAGGMAWFSSQFPRDTAAIAQAVTDIAPRPKIAMIGGDMSIGFPVTRLVHGRWSERPPSQWVTAGARRLTSQGGIDPPRAAALERYEAFDRGTLRDDILMNRPDILLVESKRTQPFDWLDWARADPQLASALDDYALVKQIDDVQIWRRR
jgi:hypothetical protein